MWRCVKGGPLPYMTSAPDLNADGIGFPIPEIFPKGGDHIPNKVITQPRRYKMSQVKELKAN
jgi:hypothetical protein